VTLKAASHLRVDTMSAALAAFSKARALLTASFGRLEHSMMPSSAPPMSWLICAPERAYCAGCLVISFSAFWSASSDGPQSTFPVP